MSAVSAIAAITVSLAAASLPAIAETATETRYHIEITHAYARPEYSPSPSSDAKSMLFISMTKRIEIGMVLPG